MIRVLIVDDHQLVRQGVAALLLKAKDVSIVGEARDGQEAIDLAQRLTPDVILMDIEMPRMSGLRATEHLKTMGHSPRILILSMRTEEKDVRAAAHSGADGFVIKNSSREELIEAIRTVNQGKTAVSPSIAPFFDRDGSDPQGE